MAASQRSHPARLRRAGPPRRAGHLLGVLAHPRRGAGGGGGRARRRPRPVAGGSSGSAGRRRGRDRGGRLRGARRPADPRGRPAHPPQPARRATASTERGFRWVTALQCRHDPTRQDRHLHPRRRLRPPGRGGPGRRRGRRRLHPRRRDGRPLRAQHLHRPAGGGGGAEGHAAAPRRAPHDRRAGEVRGRLRPRRGQPHLGARRGLASPPPHAAAHPGRRRAAGRGHQPGHPALGRGVGAGRLRDGAVHDGEPWLRGPGLRRGGDGQGPPAPRAGRGGAARPSTSRSTAASRPTPSPTWRPPAPTSSWPGRPCSARPTTPPPCAGCASAPGTARGSGSPWECPLGEQAAGAPLGDGVRVAGRVTTL